MACVSRKVDHLGRVTLPVEIRRKMSLEEGDAVDIVPYGMGVLLRKSGDDSLLGRARNLLECAKAQGACYSAQRLLQEAVWALEGRPDEE